MMDHSGKRGNPLERSGKYSKLFKFANGFIIVPDCRMMDYRSRTEHVFDHLFSFLGIPKKSLTSVFVLVEGPLR